ncbi:hypothetical protein RN001_011825 [Aquatica leii]|uniref:Ionotropic glutamate receptor L-glutamate and glycine-binding domain-containing protein n=1 Tax=Aquatica leii TaxID=1421715 RepID=A0AAN7QE65_9COLE|nr:hypothetical protein RN001_011825 [Aquatica leii]
MIIIASSEDFFSSTEDTQLILEEVNNAGCEVYIIALENGKQASQLLIFGEKYRLLNTRGKFIILHNHQLFHQDLHYLWQRIINVIFIREYKGHQKRNYKKKPVPWFELSTVQYPFPIPKVMVPKRVDIWRQSIFRTGAELFKDKTSDLKNQTLQVVTFAHIPATLKVQFLVHDNTKTVMTTKNRRFAGIEIEILQTLSKALNFVPNLYESENADIELWGTKLPDGEYTGLIGEMVNNNADIALGDLHYTLYFLKIIDLSIPYNTECLTFLTPESLTNNSWKTLVLPFTAYLWATILLSMILIAFLFRGLCKFHCNVNKDIFKDLKTRKMALKLEIEKTELVKIGQNLSPNATYCLMKRQYKLPKIEGEPTGLHMFQSIGNSLLYTYSMLLVISLPKLPTGWSIRMLTGCYWLYCILIVVAYKASMTAILANPDPRVTIDTLQELVDSELECGGWGEINVDFFQTSMDHATQVIGARFQIINDTDEAIDKIAKGSFALYENEYFLKQASVKKQLRYTMPELNLNESFEIHKIPKGDHNLHIMSDCLIHMPISIGLQKNSPIKTKVDKFVRRVLEAGLIKKWLDDVMQSANNDEVYFDDSDSIKAVMNMKKFFGAIVALFIGYAISFTVLIFEILHFKLIVKKHPNYNKYTKQIIN